MKTIGMTIGLMGLALGVFAQEIPATKTTISMKEAPIAEVCRAISDKSGNLTVFRANEGEKSELKAGIEAKEEPYWSMMRRFCEANGLALVQPPVYNQWVCVGPWNGKSRMQASRSGVFLVQLKSATVRKIEDFGAGAQRRIQLEMILSAEPKAGVFKIAQAPTIENATTEGGKNLAITSNEEPMFDELKDPTWHRFSADVKYEPETKKLKTVSGKLWAIQEVKSEDWVIEPDKAVGATKTCCDLDVIKITKFGIERNLVKLEMEIQSTQGETLLTPMVVQQRLTYENEEGKPVTIHTLIQAGVGSSVNGKMFRTMGFQSYMGDGEAKLPAKIILRVPAEVKAAAVGFEFKDVELP